MRFSAGTAIVLAIFTLSACKGRKGPVQAREIPARSAEKILERVLAHEPDTFRTYSAKASVSLNLPEGDRSFKAQIRTVRDSAAWVSVVPALGIEVARVLITTDSMKFLDKLHDRYFAGSYDTAKEKFGLQPELDLLEAALSGRPIGLDPKEKYRSDRENGLYVLTSREKKRFVKAAEEIAPGDTLSDDREMGERKLERTLRRAEEREAIVYRYWIEPEHFRVTRMQVIDLAQDRSAEIHYLERSGEDLLHLPTKLQISMNEPGRSAGGTLELSKITIGEPQMISFSIPEKYEPMP